MSVICDRCGGIAQTKEIKWVNENLEKKSAEVCEECYRELEKSNNLKIVSRSKIKKIKKQLKLGK